jgi:hypothetical protein
VIIGGALAVGGGTATQGTLGGRLNTQSHTVVVSLGPDCRTAFQIRRKFGRGFCPSGVFDSQLTPQSGFAKYLEHDLRGMFERSDMTDVPKGVLNIRSGAMHLHEFLNGLDADYATARSRHDYLCAKMQRILHGTAPTLFVAQANDPQAFIDEI